jgi:Putative Ig domain
LIRKDLRIALLLGVAFAFLIPSAGLIHPAKACCGKEVDLVVEYYQAPIMDFCSQGYGKVNLITDVSKLFYDAYSTADWYFYHTHLQTVPGKQACNSDWRTDDTWAKYHLTNQGSDEWLVDYSPTGSPGPQTSFTVSLGANLGVQSQGTFSVSWTYTMPDQVMHDQGDFSTGTAKWWDDINEQGDVPISTGSYTSEPGFAVKTVEGGISHVSSASDSNSPCSDCSLKVAFAKPDCAWWLCYETVYVWMTGTLYFDAYQPGDSPNSPVITNIPNQSTNEGQQLSFQAYASDQDGDPVTFSLPSAPSGASITPGGAFTWTPGDNTEGTYSVLVQASDGYGGTASQWFSIIVNEADGATFETWTPPPANMAPGATASVSVTMKNTGTSTWQPASSYPPNPYRLGTQNPQDNQNWGLYRVELTQAVPPGGVYTFNFQISAPSTPGTYNFQMRMVEEWIEWFGDYSPSVTVTVGSPTNRLTNPGFETGSFSSWSASSGACIRADAPSVHSGSYSAAPCYDPNTFIYAAFTLQQNITPVAGSQIGTISLWFRYGTSADSVRVLYTDGTYTTTNFPSSSGSFALLNCAWDTTKTVSGIEVVRSSGQGTVLNVDDFTIQ